MQPFSDVRLNPFVNRTETNIRIHGAETKLDAPSQMSFLVASAYKFSSVCKQNFVQLTDQHSVRQKPSARSFFRYLRQKTIHALSPEAESLNVQKNLVAVASINDSREKSDALCTKQVPLRSECGL